MAFNKDAIKSIEFSILPSDNRNVTFLKIDMIYDFTASYHEYGKRFYLFADNDDRGEQYQFYEVRRNNSVVQYTCTIAEEANKPNPIVRSIKSKDRARIAGIKFNYTYDRNNASSYPVIEVTNDKVVCASRIESQNNLFHPVNRLYNETKNVYLTAVKAGLERNKTIQADVGHDGTNFNFIPKQPITDGYEISAEALSWLNISPLISNHNLVQRDSSAYDFSITGNVYLPSRSSYTFPIMGFVSPRSVSEAMMSTTGAWRHGNMNMDPYIFEPNKYSPYRQFDKNRQFDSRYFRVSSYYDDGESGPAMTPYTNAYINFGNETEIVSNILFPIVINASKDILIIDPNTVPGTEVSLDKIVGVSLKQDTSTGEYRPVFLFSALVKGSLTFRLSQLPIEKLSPDLFGKIDLSQTITINPNYDAVYDGGVFAVERGGFIPDDIESIEYRDESITVSLAENVHGSISLKFSNAKNKFDSELTPETDRDYTSELGDHRMTFELSDGYIEERRVNLSFIENAGLGRYKMTFAAVGQVPKTKKEILFEKVKSEIVGFRREYNSNTQADDLQLIFKNEQHSPVYIRALNINGLIGRHEAIEGAWDASEWTSEINQLFTDGPYGPFVDVALSQNNTDNDPEDTIWVKFYRLPLTPHQYNVVPTGNESEYGKMLSFTCLRFDTSGNNEISLVVADTADTTTSYSAIPSAAALPSNGRLGDVKVLDTFFPINTKNDTFSSINQSIQVSTTYVGGIETRSFSNLVPPALLSGKYTARGTNVAQLANRILSGMHVLFQLGPDYPKMLVYPVINGNYIDFYPYKVGDNKVAPHPQASKIIDWLINRGLNNVPESSVNGVSRDAFVRPVTGLPTNITIPGEESLDGFLSKIREKINAFDEGTSPRAVRNAYVKEVLSRVGLSDSNLYPLFEQTPITISTAPLPKVISINDALHNDLDNVVPSSNPDKATVKPGTIHRDTQLDILRGSLDRGENLANAYRDFSNRLNDALVMIRNEEASLVTHPQTGQPILPAMPFPIGTTVDMEGGDRFTHLIDRAPRPTKPAQTAVKPVKQDYNDKADAYNRYLDALKARYGYNFDTYKIPDTEKFNLARPYVVDMPSTQYGNPEFDKPIDGATPGDLIGFIAEMVYGIQNDRTRNVLETIPGIYIPAVIPAEYRYLGRKDDVIKNQFIRVLNKWIELKPKKGLVREERDAFDALVDELIILSDNPITQSGLEDGSVYSLSTLFKGSLLNQDE